MSFSMIANLLKNKASTEKDKKLMKELFKMADKNQDGVIDYQEYIEMFQKKGITVDEEDIKRIFRMADKNGDWKISVDEILDDDREVREKAEVAFRAYDRNKDGLVSKAEMAQISGGRITKEQIEKCFEINDQDKDGYLTQEELEAMMIRRKRK